MKMRGKISSVILRIVMYASAGFTAAALLFILGYILAKGIPNLTSPGLFAWEYTSDNVSLVPAAINTLMLVALALVIWIAVLLFRDPKGVIKASLFRRQ